MVLDIYTDGSSDPIINSVNIRIGAVVVDQSDPDYKGFKYSRKTTIHNVKSQLGFNEDDIFNSNSTIAEYYSIHEILKEINRTRVHIEVINIYTDSLIVFNIYNGIQKARCHMIKRIFGSVNHLIFKMKSEVNVMWIKGHSGTWGNEEADKLCKSKRKIEMINEIQGILPKL